jgi:hypothetical protein
MFLSTPPDYVPIPLLHLRLVFSRVIVLHNQVRVSELPYRLNIDLNPRSYYNLKLEGMASCILSTQHF